MHLNQQVCQSIADQRFVPVNVFTRLRELIIEWFGKICERRALAVAFLFGNCSPF